MSALRKPPLAEMVAIRPGHCLRIIMGHEEAAARSLRESSLGYRDHIWWDPSNDPVRHIWVLEDNPILVFIESPASVDYLERLGQCLMNWGAKDVTFIHSWSGKARRLGDLRD